MARTVIGGNSVLRSWLTYVVFGAAIGVIYFLVSLAMDRYVITPLVCGVMSSASQCLNSVSMASNITTLLVAIGAVFAAIRLEIPRPLLVVVAATAMVWGMADWTLGLFWLEALAWTVLIYALAYTLFSWINRSPNIILATVICLVIIVAERIVLAF